jgi:hypothetical protein
MFKTKFREWLNEENATIKALRKIVSSKQASRVPDIGGQKGTKVDLTTAHTLLTVYDALSGPNKEKFERMLTKDDKSFKKLLDFAFEKTG